MGKEQIKLKENITQYYSKWRKCWVYFMDSYGNKYRPNKSELEEFKKYKYLLR